MKCLLIITLFCLAVFPALCQVKKGQPAPEIALTEQDGQFVKLSDLRGKVILIDFWASWCGPCRNNNPRLVKLYKKFHAMGLEILGVSVDDNVQSWKSAIIEDGLEWIQVNDHKGWEGSAAKAYDVNAIPASFLLDKEGILRGADLEGRALEAKIRSLLKK